MDGRKTPDFAISKGTCWSWHDLVYYPGNPEDSQTLIHLSTFIWHLTKKKPMLCLVLRISFSFETCSVNVEPACNCLSCINVYYAVTVSHVLLYSPSQKQLHWHTHTHTHTASEKHTTQITFRAYASLGALKIAANIKWNMTALQCK